MCIKACIPSSAWTTPLIILNKVTSECITFSFPHTSWTWRGLNSPSCAPSSCLLFFFATFASGTGTLVSHISHGWLFWVSAVLCASLIFCVSYDKTTSSLSWWLMKSFLFINSRRLEIPHFFSVNLWLWARQKRVCLIQGRRDFPCGHGNDERPCVMKTAAQSDYSWWSPPTADAAQDSLSQADVTSRDEKQIFPSPSLEGFPHDAIRWSARPSKWDGVLHRRLDIIIA